MSTVASHKRHRNQCGRMDPTDGFLGFPCKGSTVPEDGNLTLELPLETMQLLHCDWPAVEFAVAVAMTVPFAVVAAFVPLHRS